MGENGPIGEANHPSNHSWQGTNLTQMSIQVTRTKIIPPRRHTDLFSRQRLLDLLHDLLDYKLLLIIAPAGYGKTSLLIDLAHHIELPVCWYTLDPLDMDPQRFIAHFIASIAHRFPRFGQQSAANLQSTSLTGLDLDRLVTTIVNEAYEHIQEHFALVLDDYHFVDGSQAIGHFISRFVQEVDENCHLILSSRTLLALPNLPLMVARSHVGGLGSEELAFRAEEIQSLVLQNYHLTMPGSAAEKLAHETEGWITGLLLSTETLWQGVADRVRLAHISGVGLHDYLAQQVLDQQSAAVRDFLLRTSLLEEFDAQLCEAVLGPAEYPTGESWQSLIETVLRHNLFVLPIGDEGAWLRYHSLFRDFLQVRLAQERPGEEVRILQRLAAVYAERKDWEKAHYIFRHLGDVGAITDLLEQAGSALLKDGRWAILAEWLDALPADILTSRPALLSLRGIVAVMQGEAERGLRLLNQAEAAYRAAGDLPHLAHTLVRRAVAHRFMASHQASLADTDEALTLVKENPSLRAVQAEALRIRGVTLSEMGQVNQAIKWLEQSLAAYQALHEAQNVAMLLMDLGLAYENAGRYNQALTHYNRALDYWRKNNNIAWQANLLNNLGVLHHLRGDYERAHSTLEEALACARQSGYARIEAFTLASIGDLYANLDAPDAALLAHGQGRETAQRIDDRFLLLYLDLAEAMLARSKGELTQARRLLESVGRRAQESGSAFEQCLCQLETGRLALVEGKAREAIAPLEMATRCFEDIGQRVEGARAYLYLAMACQTSGDQEAALANLRQAFRLASCLEDWHPLVVAGREATTLLKMAQNDPTVGRQATQLLRQVAKFEQDIPTLRRRLRLGPSSVPFAPPGLTIQALSRARVTVNGRQVTNADWQTQTACDLFFLLLAHPDGLTKEAVGTIFWPDCSPAQVKLNFKNTIYRLRHALGQDAILFNEDIYRFNRELDYDYDVENFLDKVAQAIAATSPNEQATAYQAAIRLYKGSYLPEMDGTWVWPERERLWQTYLEAILKLAEFHLEAKEYKVALTYCQRALAEDPCLEDAHRLAMRVHAAMGNRAAISRQFKRCQEVLLEEIGASPSPQTEKLYQTLMH